MKIGLSSILGGAAVIGLLAWGVASRFTGHDSQEPVDGGKSPGSRSSAVISSDGGATTGTKKRGLSMEGLRSLQRMEDRFPEVRSDHLPRPLAQGEMTPEEAAVAFEGAIMALDEALEQDEKLSSKERGDLYNQATGAFTILSRHADAADPAERALLEDAYRQMRERMAALGLDRRRDAGRATPAPR